MIHRQRNLWTELLHNEIEIHPRLYLTFILSISLLLLSYSFSGNSKHEQRLMAAKVDTGQVQGLTAPNISFTQDLLSTTVDQNDPRLYKIRIKVTVANNNPLPISKVHLQNSLTQGWQSVLLNPKILSVTISNPLTRNGSFDGYATSVMNIADDILTEFDESIAIIELRVNQPPTDVVIENNIILQANYDGNRVTQLSTLPLLIPGKSIQSN